MKNKKLKGFKKIARTFGVILLTLVFSFSSFPGILGFLSPLIGTVLEAPEAQANPDNLYFTNTNTSSPVTPSGKLTDANADNDTEFTLDFSASNPDRYWYSVEIPSGEVNGGIAAGDYSLNLYFNNYQSAPAGQGGVTSKAAYSIVPSPGGKDKPANYGVTYYNPTGSTSSVTKVLIGIDPADVDGGNPFWETTVIAGYPTSGWSSTGGEATWSGAGEAVPAYSATVFWVQLDASKSSITTTLNTTTTADSVTYTHNGYATENWNANASAPSLYFDTDSDLTNYEYEIAASAGAEEATYTIVVQEQGLKASLDAGNTLTIDIPSGFTGVTCPGQSGWNAASTCTNTQIIVTTSAVIAVGGKLAYQFQATPPAFQTKSIYNLHVNFTGGDNGGKTVNSHANLPIEVTAATDNLVFKAHVAHAGASATGPGGETSITQYSSIGRPFGKDKMAALAVVLFNPSSSAADVTKVTFASANGLALWQATVTAGYPTSGWTAGTATTTWTGTDSVPARSARAYWMEMKSNGKNLAMTTIVNTQVTFGGTVYTHSAYTTETDSGAGTQPIVSFSGKSWVDTSTGGTEDTYTIDIHEDGGKGTTVNSGGSLYVDIPSGFTDVTCIASQTGWADATTCTNSLVAASSTASIASLGTLSYQFKATPPIFATKSLYKIHANFTGLDSISLLVDSHFNGAIEVAGDPYASTAIVSSGNITILSSSTSPAVISIGSGSSQTFLTSDKRRMRLRLEFVSGGSSIDIQYNDNDTNPSRVVTPTIDFGGVTTAYEQKEYRFYENTDAIQPSTTLAGENTTTTFIGDFDVVRLRTNVKVTGEQLDAGGQDFKLQYGAKSSTAACSAASFSDVGAIGSATIWRGFDNSTPADGAAITSTLLTSSTVLESYEEANNSATNPNAIAINAVGEWDWVIQNNYAPGDTIYCFRMVKSDGTALNTYTTYPAIETVFSGGGDDGITTETLTTQLAEKWTPFQTFGGVSFSSPAIGEHIYIGSDNGVFYAIDKSNGAQAWRYPASGTIGAISTNPVVFEYGKRIGFGSDDGKFYVVRKGTGTLAWSFDASAQGPVTGSPVVGADNIYFATEDGTVYARNRLSGSFVWTVTPGGAIDKTSLTTDSTGSNIYMATSDGEVFKLAASNGATVWSYVSATDFFSNSSPVKAGGYVFLGSDNGLVYAIHDGSGQGTDGTLAATFNIGSDILGRVAYNSIDDDLIVGSLAGDLYRLSFNTASPAFSQVWKVTVGAQVESSPVISTGGTSHVYVGADAFYMFNYATGALEYTSVTNRISLSSPAVANGEVYVADINGKVYAFDETTVLGAFTESWSQTTTGSKSYTTGLARSGGNLYGGTSDGLLYSYADTGGAANWTFNALTSISSMPVVNVAASGGNIFTTIDGCTDCDTSGTVGTFWLRVDLDSSDNPVIAYYDQTNGDLKLVHCGDANCSTGNTFTVVDGCTGCDFDGDAGFNSSVVLDSSGNPVISYLVALQGPTRDALKIVHCGDPNCSSGNTYTILDGCTTCDTSGLVAWWRTSIVLDSSGNPVIAYYDQTNGDLKIIHCGNANCTSGNTIVRLDGCAGCNTNANLGLFPDLALDSSGNPIVAYYEDIAGGTGNLHLVHCGNANCTSGNTFTVVDGCTGCNTDADMGWELNMTLDSSGNPVISYLNFDAFELNLVHCGNATCSTGNTFVTLDGCTGCDTTVRSGRFSWITLDSLGYPVISYYTDFLANGTVGDLKLVHCGDANCSSGNTFTLIDGCPTCDTDGDVGWRGAHILDASGNPVIVHYSVTDTDLKLVHCSDANCTGSGTIDTVFFGTQDQNFYGVNTSNGSQRWAKTNLGHVTSEPLVSGTSIYVPTVGGTIYDLNNDTGATNFSYSTGFAGQNLSNPLVSGTQVFFTYGNRALVALNTADFTKAWEFNMGGSNVTEQPIFIEINSASSTLYGGGVDGVYAVSFTGTADPSWPAGGKFTTNAIVTGIYYDSTNDLVIASTQTGTLYGINAANGTQTWSLNLSSSAITKPARHQDVVMVYSAKELSVVSMADGKIRSSQFINMPFYPPAIDATTAGLYMPSVSGTIRKYNTDQHTMTVGAEGGTVTTIFGDNLQIPANSIVSATSVTVTITENTEDPGGGLIALPRKYDFDPDGLTFSPPAVFSVAYKDADLGGLAEADIRVFVFSSTSSTWMSRSGTLDVTNKLFIVNLGGFSTYASFAGIPPELDIPIFTKEYNYGSTVVPIFGPGDASVSSVTATLNGSPISSGQSIVLGNVGTNTVIFTGHKIGGGTVSQTQTFQVLAAGLVASSPTRSKTPIQEEQEDIALKEEEVVVEEVVEEEVVVTVVIIEDRFVKYLKSGIVSDPEVEALQELLTFDGVYFGPITGNFFDLTKAAITLFQKKYGITTFDFFSAEGDIPGAVGPLTRAKLNEIWRIFKEPAAIEQEVEPAKLEPTIEEVIEVVAESFLANLKFGMVANPDVKRLQQFLTDGGLYFGPVNGNFFTLTRAAVIKFQEKYTKDTLSPWGLTKGTGYVGKTTRAKINELLKAQAPKVSLPAVPAVSESFTTNLKFGMVANPDVKRLQQFLTDGGLYFGPVNGNFFTLTRAAVIKFQEKYTKDTLSPWGLTKGTGYVGKTTRAKINELLEK